MKVKGAKKFKELGIDNSYQGLDTEVYFALRRGEIVEIDKIPEHLEAGGYVEKLKSVKAGKKERG